MAEELRLGIGGPLHRLERAAHMEPLGRLVPLLLAMTWAPLVAFALVQRATSGSADSLIRDLSVHARLLVAMPLFLVAERLLDRVGRITVARLLDEGYVPASSMARVRALIRGVERWRDAALPEAILLVAAVITGAVALIGWISPAGLIHGSEESRYDAVRLWYGLAALPIFQFLLWRSLFRWVLWLRVLVGLTRVPLRLLPAHADRRGGIGFMRTAQVLYSSVMLLATSAVLCAGWETELEAHKAPIATLRPALFVFVMIGLSIAFAPLLMFTPHLLRARIIGIREYGSLVSDYTRRFHQRWVARLDHSDFLGTPDIQSLADLGNTYQGTIDKLGIFLFARADALLVLIASLLPVIPLLLVQSPAPAVINRIVGMLVGKMP